MICLAGTGIQPSAAAQCPEIFIEHNLQFMLQREKHGFFLAKSFITLFLYFVFNVLIAL